MRLLEDDGLGNLSLVEKHDHDIPRYAILSHTWGADGDEVTSKDFTEGTDRKKAGYKKIEFCRAQATSDGLQYFWVDSCCIDKSGSAELSEAINSMFRCYQNAEKCYVYLSDVSTSGEGSNPRLSQTAYKAAFRGKQVKAPLSPLLTVPFRRDGDLVLPVRSLVNREEAQPGHTHIHQEGPLFGATRVSGGVSLQGIFAGLTINSTARPDYRGQFCHSSLEPVKAFVPRPLLRDQIRTQLCDDAAGEATRTLVVWGLGGSGKSQLVLDYLRQHRTDYKATFWIEAGRKESLDRDFVNLYQTLFSIQMVAGKETVSVESAVTGVKSCLSGQRGPWLMVFDGADTIEYKVKNANGVKGQLGVFRQHGGQRGDPTFSIAAKNVYLNNLREAWQSLPKPPHGLSYSNLDDEDDEEDEDDHFHNSKRRKKSEKQKKTDKFMKAIGGKWAQNFALTLVSASVVPNYYPALRVIDYSITGLENAHPAAAPIAGFLSGAEAEPEWVDELCQDDFHDLKKKKKKGKKSQKPKFTIPKPPSESAPPGPAYSPQTFTFTFTSCTQYFANLTRINNVDLLDKHKKKKPDPKKFEYEVEYISNNDTHYELQDLTMRSYLDLAQKVAKKTVKGKDFELDDEDSLDRLKKKPKNHVWRAFVKRAFLGTNPEKELDDHFG